MILGKSFKIPAVSAGLLAGVLAFAGAGSAVAKGGGGGGGGGGGTSEPVVLSTSVVTCPFPSGTCVAGVIGSDRTVRIAVEIQSDAGDTPAIVQTSGPPLVPVQILPAGRGADAKGVKFGIQNAVYEWTPRLADIGLDASAAFVATTASGKTVGVTVPIGIVGQLAPGVISGLTATAAGSNFVVKWNPPADRRAVTYTLGVCPAIDPALGGPICRSVAMPGVATTANPGGTLTTATIPGVFPAGFFTQGVSERAAFLILRANGVTTFSLQENVLRLPQ